MPHFLEIDDPEIFEILQFFWSPPYDHGYHSLEHAELLSALERCPALRTRILALTEAVGDRAGALGLGQVWARAIEARLAAQEALRDCANTCERPPHVF